MEVLHYRVREDSDLYAKVKELDAVIKDCWKKADAMAKKYHAHTYLHRHDAYAGGISALYFDETRPLNDRVWEKVKVDRNGTKGTVYVPRVEIRKEWMKPEKADKLELGINRMIIRKPSYPLVRVLTFIGTTKAIKIYRNLLSLPIVPAGTLEALIGLENPEYQCGYFIKLQHIYIASYEPTDHPDLLPCSEEEEKFLEEQEQLARKEDGYEIN